MATIPFKADPAAPSPPIDAQIAEIRRELDIRRDFYPKRVREGKMRQLEADLFMSRLEAVLRSLEYMREHRAVIVAAVKANREAS